MVNWLVNRSGHAHISHWLAAMSVNQSRGLQVRSQSRQGMCMHKTMSNKNSNTKTKSNIYIYIKSCTCCLDKTQTTVQQIHELRAYHDVVRTITGSSRFTLLSKECGLACSSAESFETSTDGFLAAVQHTSKETNNWIRLNGSIVTLRKAHSLFYYNCVSNDCLQEKCFLATLCHMKYPL